MGERNIAAATLVATLLACWAVPARAAQADELAAAEARAARAEQEHLLLEAPQRLCMSCHAGELDAYQVVGDHEFRFIKR